MFRDWILVNCSSVNYFICSRPINKGIASESQSFICIDNQFEFSCPSVGSIYVDFAAYGNIGIIGFFLLLSSRKKIAIVVRRQVHNNRSSCYWMDGFERLGGSSFCGCYYITSRSAFWSQRSCNSSQQWVCQFAPETQFTEVHNKFMEQHTIFNRLSNVERFEWKWDGITVPRTMACNEIEIPCPDSKNTIGVTTQKCSCESNGWEGKPNTANCTHKWVGLLDQMIDSDEPVENISRKWAQFLQNSAKLILFDGDLVGSIKIGEKLLSLARVQYAILENEEERNEKTIEFTEMYGEAGNELLSDHAAIVWMTLPDDVRIREISSLISELEQSAALMAEFITEKQKRIEYNNWAFEVQVKEPIPMTVQSNHVDNNDKSKLVRRSHIFDAITFTNISSSYANADFNELNENVTFSFSLSPTLLMPPLKLLQQSAQVVLSTFGDSSLLMRPRSRLIPTRRSLLLVAYSVFRSVGALLNTNKTTIANSLIIGASVNDPMTSIPLPESHPVTFKFYHIRTSGVNNPRCVSWDTSKKIWSKEGCKTLRTMNDSTECSCTHLTSFAILMDITGLSDHDKESVVNQVLNLTTTVACIFSIICLSLASLVFTCFRSLWSVCHMIHSNLCFCLLLAELVFVTGTGRTENRTICRAVAVTLHYFFLADVTGRISAVLDACTGNMLLLFILIHVFENEEGKTVFYSLYAYGFPGIIVAITVGVAWSNYSTDQYPILQLLVEVETPTIWAFAGPVAVVIVSNIVFLGVALRVVLSVPNRHRSRMEQILGWLKGSATLLSKTVFAYIFTILNCLQGVFIFIIHVVLNDKVRSTLLRFLRANICCLSDANTPSVVSTDQKIIDMMKNSDLSRVSSQPLTGSSDLKSIKREEKGLFVEKISSRMDGKGSPTTMITYLDWKRKVSNDSISTPSDGCGNYDCEKKEALPVSTDSALITDLSRENSDIDGEGKSFTIHPEISYSNEDRFKPIQKRSSKVSAIIERF
uniref:GPS domain-containing protein n=1 Tax=Wuchereria bancrofti TaxID=6293 RepID=A0AAF5PXH9_WUCBA